MGSIVLRHITMQEANFQQLDQAARPVSDLSGQLDQELHSTAVNTRKCRNKPIQFSLPFSNDDVKDG
jgi:hypothetical protein